VAGGRPGRGPSRSVSDPAVLIARASICHPSVTRQFRRWRHPPFRRAIASSRGARLHHVGRLKAGTTKILIGAIRTLCRNRGPDSETKKTKKVHGLAPAAEHTSSPVEIFGADRIGTGAVTVGVAATARPRSSRGNGTGLPMRDYPIRRPEGPFGMPCRRCCIDNHAHDATNSAHPSDFTDQLLGPLAMWP